MRATTYALAGGLVVVLGAMMLWPVKPSTPPAPTPPAPPPKPTEERWAELGDVGGRIWLGQGWLYRAIVKLPWYVPTPSNDTARVYAEGKGFSDVIVSHVRPSWATEEGDLYVTATWAKASQWFDRASAITKAWVKL